MRRAATRSSGPTARIAGAVSAYVAAAGRRLPRGWADLGRQFAIWFGFLGAYQLARGAAGRSVGGAPRFFPEAGFSDTLSQYGSLNHGTGLIQLASNQFAAMPSLHSADALVVGLVLASVVQHRWAKAAWLAWPLWVWFSVMSTGNHFWLDIAAGVLVAGIAAAVIYRPWRRFA